MGIMESINAGVNSAMKACKNGTDSVKAKAKIVEQERLIEKMTAEIGNLMVVELDNGQDASPAIMERYEAIKVARAIIAELEVEKSDGSKVCPNCGKRSIGELAYCGACGTKLVLPEEMAVEAPVEEDKEDTEE